MFFPYAGVKAQQRDQDRSTALWVQRGIMRTILGILIVLLIVTGAAAAASFVHGPYSGAPTQTTVAISWLSSDPVPAHVNYGIRSDYEASCTFSNHFSVSIEESADRNPLYVTLTSLEPTSQYVYQVVLETPDGEVASSLGYFQTVPLPEELVEFTILADTQWQWEGENRPSPRRLRIRSNSQMDICLTAFCYLHIQNPFQTNRDQT